MNYQDIRDSLRSGDIIALSHDKWTSWYDLQVQAVRFFTQSEYCHVAVVWSYAGRVFIIESVEPVVRIYPLSNLALKGFYHIPTNTPMTDKELNFLMSKVGEAKYSKIEAILAQLNLLKIGKDEFYECAELAIVARAMSDLDLGNKATPSAVVQTLLDSGHSLTFVNMENKNGSAT